MKRHEEEATAKHNRYWKQTKLCEMNHLHENIFDYNTILVDLYTSREMQPYGSCWWAQG